MPQRQTCYDENMYVMTPYLHHSERGSVMSDCLMSLNLGHSRTKAVFTQRSLSDLTLDQSKVRSDKVCVNTLNRVGKPGR